METTIRLAVEGDVARLTEIYNHYIAHTPITFDIEPFTVEQRMEWFAHYHVDGPHRIFVAEREGVVLGSAWSSEFRPKKAYETTIEVSVYCAPEATGLGLGSMLYERLFAEIGSERLHRAVAGITQPNEASGKLHAKFGFRQVALLSEVGFKLGRYWDVAWMEKAL